MSSVRLEQKAEKEAEEAAQQAEQASRKSTPNPFNLSSLRDALPEEEEEEITETYTPFFPLLSLPPELRLRIFEYYFFSDRERKLPRHMVIRSQATEAGLQPRNISIRESRGFFKGRSNIMLSCRQIHRECAYLLYSTQPFRIFPHHQEDYKPSLERIPAAYKPLVKTLRLILGAGWTDPPERISSRLGLGRLVGLRRVQVMIEVDPSSAVHAGFRRSETFYTAFCAKLLRVLLLRLPHCVVVEFDGVPSIRKNGSMMRALYRVARGMGARIEYGPISGWSRDAYDEEDEAMLMLDASFEKLKGVRGEGGGEGEGEGESGSGIGSGSISDIARPPATEQTSIFGGDQGVVQQEGVQQQQGTQQEVYQQRANEEFEDYDDDADEDEIEVEEYESDDDGHFTYYTDDDDDDDGSEGEGEVGGGGNNDNDNNDENINNAGNDNDVVEETAST